MATSDLDILLVEYEQKKRDAEFDLQKRKEKIYKKIPRLEEIDDKINKISINKTKSILINQLTNSLNTEFENELLQLKEEKEKRGIDRRNETNHGGGGRRGKNEQRHAPLPSIVTGYYATGFSRFPSGKCTESYRQLP